MIERPVTRGSELLEEALACLAQSQVTLATARRRMAACDELLARTSTLRERATRLSAHRAERHRISGSDPRDIYASRRRLRDPIEDGEDTVFPALGEDPELIAALAPESHASALELLHARSESRATGLWRAPTLHGPTAYGALVTRGLLAPIDSSRGVTSALLGPGDLIVRRRDGDAGSPDFRVLAPVRVAFVFEHASLLGLDASALEPALRSRRAALTRRQERWVRLRRLRSPEQRVLGLLTLTLELWGESAARRTPAGLDRARLAWLLDEDPVDVVLALRRLTRRGEVTPASDGAWVLDAGTSVAR